MKFLFIFFFPLFCTAQITNPEFSAEDINTFITVLLKSKSSQSNHDQKIISLLNDFNISHDRYGNILKSRINNLSIPLSENEIAAIKQIETINTEIKNEKQSTLISLCKTHGISFERYNHILEKWKSDPDLKLQIQTVLTKLSEQK
jgi:hypothetical protein